MSTATNNQTQPAIPISPIKTNTDTNTSQTSKQTTMSSITSTSTSQANPVLSIERHVKS